MQRTQHVQSVFILEQMESLLKLGWHTGTFARREDGTACYPEDKKAISFDLAGAFYRVVYLHRLRPAVVRSTKAALIGALNEVNPHKTFASILKENAADDDRFRGALSAFNDTPQRAKMEIFQLIKKAKERL